MAVLDMAAEQIRLITRMVKAGEKTVMKIDVQNEFSKESIQAENIVGQIPGAKSSEQIIFLGAHLDSWDLATGSVDDGFGVAAVLGAAKAILTSGIRPSRTIRFVLFTGEEQGLLGSTAYIHRHESDVKNFVCALVLDWGSGPITKLPLAGHPEMAAAFQELFQSDVSFASLKTVAGYMTYTDAFSFTLAGVPGIAFFQVSPDYALIAHSSADTLDKVERKTLVQNTKVLASCAIWIADHSSRVGMVFSVAEVKQSLEDQAQALRMLGLWPF